MNQEQVSQFQSFETRIADLEKLCGRQRTSLSKIVFAFVLGTVSATLVAGGLSVFAQTGRADVVDHLQKRDVVLSPPLPTAGSFHFSRFTT